MRHAPTEGLGLLGPPLRRRGVRGVRLDVFRGQDIPRTLPQGVLLIVLGGPYGVRDSAHAKTLNAETRLIADCLDRGAAVLGVCLGAELLARAAGGKLGRAAAPEIGWLPVDLTPDGEADSVLGALPPRFTPLHWRTDDLTPPRDARTLARSLRGDHQAFALGPRAYGLQFHLEPTTSMIRAWLRADKRGLPAAEEERLRLLRETPLHVGPLPDLCERLIDRYLDQVFTPAEPAGRERPYADADRDDASRGWGR